VLEIHISQTRFIKNVKGRTLGYHNSTQTSVVNIRRKWRNIWSLVNTC